MELMEDERLELMELVSRSKGLPSMLSLDSDTLQQLDSFRGVTYIPVSKLMDCRVSLVPLFFFQKKKQHMWISYLNWVPIITYFYDERQILCQKSHQHEFVIYLLVHFQFEVLMLLGLSNII
jgi:hypothetical protein